MNRTIFGLFVFILSVILLNSTACQDFTSTVEQDPIIDEDALVESVVATVMARTPQVETVATPAPLPTVANTQPVTIDQGLEDQLVSIYMRINPSVVHIFVFDEIEDTSLPLGTGSGFVFDEEGHIVTNNHVVTE